MGCVGNDEFSKILESKARSEGVNVKYQVSEKDSTGDYFNMLHSDLILN